MNDLVRVTRGFAPSVDDTGRRRWWGAVRPKRRCTIGGVTFDPASDRLSLDADEVRQHPDLFTPVERDDYATERVLRELRGRSTSSHAPTRSSRRAPRGAVATSAPAMQTRSYLIEPDSYLLDGDEDDLR